MTEKEFEAGAATLRQKVLAWSRQLGASAEEAEDAAQEVLLRLWKLRDEMERFRSTEAVARQITRYVLLNEWRRVGRNVIDLNQWNTADSTSTPDQRLQWLDDQQWLEQRMKALPSTQYAILYMRQVEERSTDEIARLLGLAPTSVATLLSRARRSLFNQFKQRNAL